MSKSKDLFDDSTMSFGEHLEELRARLILAILGLVVTVILSLIFGQSLVAVVRSPIDAALVRHGVSSAGGEDLGFDLIKWFKGFYEDEAEAAANKEKAEAEAARKAKAKEDPQSLRVTAKVSDLEAALGVEAADSITSETVEITLSAPEFAQLRRAVDDMDKPKTFNVQEAFLTYLKVSLVFGVVFASPWIGTQIWLFVAAGLYPHERKYVHIYLPMSLGLFMGGALFCFYIVFPFILDFLLGFNKLLGVQPQIRLSEWISFAVMLPVMFGISFQLPLVMLFLNRISVFEVKQYRENRRMAILVIAILSMLLSPPDPTSMIFMLVPLVALYELGIFLCSRASKKETPFEEVTS